MSNCCGDSSPNSATSPSSAPFLPKDFATGSSNSVVSPVLGYRNASTGMPAPARFMQYGFDISGTGATDQSSWFVVGTGSFVPDGSGGLVQQGGFVGTRREAPTSTIGRASGSFSSAPGNVTFDSDSLPTSSTVTGTHYDPATEQYDTNNPPRYFLNGASLPNTYDFTQSEQAITPLPAGLGDNRPAQIAGAGTALTGYVGGIMRTDSSAGPVVNYRIGNATSTASDVTIQLDPATSTMQADFHVARLAGVKTLTGSFLLDNAQYKLGSIGTGDLSRGSYVDYDTFAALDARSGTSADAAPDSTVNGLAVDTTHGALLNVRPADAQAISTALGGTVICECDYSRWGVWSMDDQRTLSGDTINDRGHLMFWVAGQRPPNPGDVPVTGTATYGGHVIANVRNGTSDYLAGANFTNTVDFGAATNQLSVTVGTPSATFDGATYAGSLSLKTDRQDFQGTLAGDADRTMTMNGSFFNGASGPVGEMGGSVNVTNIFGNYSASGIFIGKTSAPAPAFAAGAFALATENCCGGLAISAPYLAPDFASPTSNLFVSNVLGYRVASPSNATAPEPGAYLQYGLNITGDNSTQSSWFFVTTGAFKDDGSNGLTQQGNFVGTRRGDPNSSAGVASETNVPSFSSTGTVSFDSNRLPTAATIAGDTSYKLTSDSADSSFSFNHNQTAIAVPAGLGSNRPAVTLNGYVGGIVQSTAPNMAVTISIVGPTPGGPTYAIGNANNSPNDVTIELHPADSRVQANFNVARVGTGDAFSLNTAKFQFGSANLANPARGAYVDYDTFAALDARTANGTSISTVNVAPVDFTQGAFLNINRDVAAALNIPGLGSTVTCECDYTRWGVWSMADGRTDMTGIFDTGHLMFWVAGQRPPSVPTTGTAYFKGHVIGNVDAGGVSLLVGAPFTTTVNFAAATDQLFMQVGTPAATFDGTVYGGSLSLKTDQRDFGGSLSGENITAVGTRTMAVDGSFFKGASSPVGEMGGSVNVTNTTGDYSASGIFAGALGFTAEPFALDMTTCCGDGPNTANSPSSAPFLPKNFADGAVPLISPVLGYRNASVGTTPAPGAFLQYGVNLTGSESNQSSWFFVATGEFRDNGNGGLIQQGGFFGSKRGSPNFSAGEAYGNLSSPTSPATGAVTQDNKRLPTGATIDQKQYVFETQSYVNDSAKYSLTAETSPVNYNFTQNEMAIPVPADLGSTRPTHTTAANTTLTGYVGGIMRTTEGGMDASFIVSGVTQSPGDVTIQLDPTTSRMQANFHVARLAGDTSSFNTGQYQFGSLDTAHPARGAYLDYDTFGGLDALEVTNQSTGATSPKSRINNQSVTTSNGAFLRANNAVAQKLLRTAAEGATRCDCEYTRWGMWTANTKRGPSSNPVDERSHLNFWVAGQRPGSQMDIPTTGMASYQGHVIANVKNGGNSYISSVNFTNTVDFAAGTLDFRVGEPGYQSLDNYTYQGQLTLKADRRDFGGSLAGSPYVAGGGATTSVTGNTRNMTMDGSFFKGISTPWGEMGGNVNVTGTGTQSGYIASGIFAGRTTLSKGTNALPKPK
jgi:hypothetical protein